MVLASLIMSSDGWRSRWIGNQKERNDMNRKKTAGLMIGILGMMLIPLLAQSPTPRARMYDPKTEMTVNGAIEDVQQLPCRSRRYGTHLLVKTDSETVEVCTGPAAYIQKSGFTFAKGDTIEVIGSKVKFNDKDYLVARQITKDNKTLTLRDAQGIPEWSGGRWRR
jgi:hypothetical protein